MVYADATYIGDETFGGRTFMDRCPSAGEVTTESLLASRANVITSGTVARRDRVVEAGLFDPAILRAQDYDMWVRLAKRGARIGYQRKVLLRYRVRGGSLSGDTFAQAERHFDVLSRLREKLGPELTTAERSALERQLAESRALADTETGKRLLARGDYRGARRSFADANRHYRRPKLFIVRMLLLIAPGLVRRVLLGR